MFDAASANVGSSAVQGCSHPPNSMEPNQMSHPKVLDPHGFRARFADYWSQFLRANYRNPEQVAVAFGVRFQTASNWWNGWNRPTGDVVAMAGQRFTDFISEVQR